MCALLMGGNSCIHDDIPTCPPMTIRIDVKDKNYFNVDEVEAETRRADNLPFRDYVPAVRWTLRDASTGETVASRSFYAVEGDQSVETVTFPEDLLFGKYVFTVWGTDGEPSSDAEGQQVEMHRSGAEGADVYLTNDTIVYDSRHSDFTVSMERVKGKLVIEKVGIPEGYTLSDKSVDALFSTVSREFEYAGVTSVAKSETLAGPDAVTRTILAPSLTHGASTLSIQFRRPALKDKGKGSIDNGADSGEEISTDEETLQPRPVNISMERNRITALRYTWSPSARDFIIQVIVDGRWQTVYNLGLEED